MTLYGIERLIEKVNGPLHARSEKGEQIWRLELTQNERNELAAALYVAQKAAHVTEPSTP